MARLVEAEAELARLCSLFHLMQGLLDAEILLRRCAPVSLNQLPLQLADDADAIVCGTEIELRVVPLSSVAAAHSEVCVGRECTRKG